MADTASIKKVGTNIPVQIGATETYSKNVLGPVSFTLCNLQIRGLAEEPEQPKNVSPAQSPYIVASNEQLEVSVDIEFNTSPLTRLLLCLGTKLTVCFSFEGIGAKAVELDLEEMMITEKDVFKYTLTWEGTPDAAGLTAGFYGIAAVATVGPVEHPCAPKCAMGFGYIAGLLLQVYDAFEAH
ncbi:MAG: hypothetical protein VKK04_00575 [Synechococcales bacterium]|nr:hypothetical protein [Synechococcales bacterium]